MSSRQESPLVITGLRGRDGYSTYEGEVPLTRASAMVNVVLHRTSFARKRNGCTDIIVSSTSGATFSGAGSVQALGRFVPGPNGSYTTAEFWGIDSAGTVNRLAGGAAWAAPTVNDAISGTVYDVTFCGFKGKLFIAYDSATDRLHAWDPTDAQVRRTGLATPAAATVANTGIGTYAATLRYYKIRYVKKSGSTYLLASELSANVSFTPSGVGTAARVTKPAAISEGETHWHLYASADNNLYFQIAETVVGTTTYDDSATPSAYSGDAPPLVGTHTVWTSVKYLMATDDHLIGAGSWESGGYTSRVWWSGVTNQTGVGDPESVIQTIDVKNYADLGEEDGGAMTGLGGPINGRAIVFKRNEVWALIPTGQDTPFYKPQPIAKGSGVGCVRHHTIVNAEDEFGRPCLYWLSDRGPYRLGPDGLQAMVDDVQDLWDTANPDFSRAFALWHPAKRQVWWWLADTNQTTPNMLWVFDVRMGRVEDSRVRNGWTTFTGPMASGLCGCLFTANLGASMGGDLGPHIGASGAVIYRGDSGTNDNGISTGYQAYVDLPARHFAGLGRRFTVGEPAVLGSGNSISMQVQMTGDYGEFTTRTGTVVMSGGAKNTLRVVEELEFGEPVYVMQVRIGDASANTNGWTLDALVLPFEPRGDVTV